MISRRLVFTCVLSAPLLFGQLTRDSVTVTVSRPSTVAADQVVFGVAVTAGSGAGFNDILNEVQGIGITAANFTGVSTPLGLLVNGAPPQPLTLEWDFQLRVPLAQMKATTARLSALQHNLGQAGSGMTLSFTVQGTQVSPAAQQAQTCDLAGLVADARTEAGQVAAPAGYTPGSILALTTSSSNGSPAPCSLTARFDLGAPYGQNEPNTITVTALRSMTLQPDQVVFGINIDTGLNAGLDDATAALSAAGVTGAAFSGVYNSTIYPTIGGQPQNLLQWSFTLTAPFSKLKDTLTQLAAAQQAIAHQNSGIQMTFSVSGSQVSTALQQAQTCPQADLMADARAQAQNVAGAAGVSVGAVFSVSGGNSLAGSAAAFAVINPYRLGNFTQTIGGNFVSSSFLLGGVTASPAYSCTLSVEFLMPGA